MKRVIIFIFLLTHFLPAITSNDIFGRFSDNLKKIKSIKADMEIEIKQGENYNFLKIKYINKGDKTFMKAPPPGSFTLVSNGKSAFFYIPRTKTVYLYDPSDKNLQYKDPVNEQKKFYKGLRDIKKVGDKFLGWKKVEVFEAKPGDRSRFISKFLIWTDVKNGMLYKLETFDMNGKITSRIEFKKYKRFGDIWLSLQTLNWSKSDLLVTRTKSLLKNVKINEKIDDSIFNFKAPKGSKIKDYTNKILSGGK